MNLGANQKGQNITGTNAKNIGYLAGCKLQSEVSLEVFNRSCDAFINGLH